MTKRARRSSMKNNCDPHKEFEKLFSKHHAGYVLITCQNPTDDGNMNVEMTFGGSAALAHILINGAQMYLEDGSSEDSEDSHPKINLVKS